MQNLKIGDRVTVEKRFTEDGQSPMKFSNGIIKTINSNFIRVITDENVIKHTYNFIGSGLFYLDSYNIYK